MDKDKECSKQNNVKVISNPKIASYLINKGFRVINIKKHRDYYCEDACKVCDKKSVFAFIIEKNFLDENFLDELEYAINNYDLIGWTDDESR